MPDNCIVSINLKSIFIQFQTESMTVDVEFVRLLHDIHSTNVHNHLYRGYTLLGTEEKLREVDVSRCD